VPGFDNMVQLTDAPVIIIEGDEYLSSPIDPTPKFLNYHHHIGLISGISWDHINVFPSENDYVKEFDAFADATPKGGTLIYCEEDSLAVVIGSKERTDVRSIKYNTHPFVIEEGKTFLLNGEDRIPIGIFGRHNLQNISGAASILLRLSISKDDFYEAIQSFKGTDTRLELVDSSEKSSVFVDYAHAPSKVLASTLAVKEQFPDRELVACLELHTFSSLNKTFLKNYKDGLRFSNYPVVYFNPKTIQHKQLEPISKEEIKLAFGSDNMKVFTDRVELEHWLKEQKWKYKNLLLMSSGTFDLLDIPKLTKHIINEA
jgi:UDP-N-acetylmuramate: L-alanyl-gamma-D-glutamyl-meso-diaminopimelate ligase